MSNQDHMRSRFVEPGIGRYTADHTTPADDVQRELREVTSARVGQWAMMQIGQDQAVLLEQLTRASGARFAVEVGTFTGYSALAIARGLGPEGRLLCCDINEEWTSIAREFWERAGVAERIELRLAPAIETLRSLPKEEHVDLAFVDADKTGYAGYYDELLPRLRVGGLILADNTLQNGRVLEERSDDESTRAIQSFNEKVLRDPRVLSVLLPIGDGVTMIQKVTA